MCTLLGNVQIHTPSVNSRILVHGLYSAPHDGCAHVVMFKIYIYILADPLVYLCIVDLAMWNWPFIALKNILLRTVDGIVDLMTHISRLCGITD